MSSRAATAALIDAASAPYWPTERILHLGCGQGLLAAGLPMSTGTPFANIMLIARPRSALRVLRPMTDPLIAQ